MKLSLGFKFDKECSLFHAYFLSKIAKLCLINGYTNWANVKNEEDILPAEVHLAEDVLVLVQSCGNFAGHDAVGGKMSGVECRTSEPDLLG